MILLKTTLVACSVVAVLLTPSTGRGQEAEPPIAVGDSVRVEIPAIFSRTGEPLGERRVVVAAVHGADGRCLTLVAPTATSISDPDSSVIVLLGGGEGYHLHRVWPESAVISGTTLVASGIECLEVYYR